MFKFKRVNKSMFRAIADGRKTQLRSIIKGEREELTDLRRLREDILQVGEHVRIIERGSGLFLTIEITDIRVQFLKDLTNDDAIASGCTPCPNGSFPNYCAEPWGDNLTFTGEHAAKQSFVSGWRASLNADELNDETMFLVNTFRLVSFPTAPDEPETVEQFFSKWELPDAFKRFSSAFKLMHDVWWNCPTPDWLWEMQERGGGKDAIKIADAGKWASLCVEHMAKVERDEFHKLGETFISGEIEKIGRFLTSPSVAEKFVIPFILKEIQMKIFAFRQTKIEVIRQVLENNTSAQAAIFRQVFKCPFADIRKE